MPSPPSLPTPPCCRYATANLGVYVVQIRLRDGTVVGGGPVGAGPQCIPPIPPPLPHTRRFRLAGLTLAERPDPVWSPSPENDREDRDGHRKVARDRSNLKPNGHAKQTSTGDTKYQFKTRKSLFRIPRIHNTTAYLPPEELTP